MSMCKSCLLFKATSNGFCSWKCEQDYLNIKLTLVPSLTYKPLRPPKEEEWDKYKQS